MKMPEKILNQLYPSRAQNLSIYRTGKNCKNNSAYFQGSKTSEIIPTREAKQVSSSPQTSRIIRCF